MTNIKNLVGRIHLYFSSPNSTKNTGLESVDLSQNDLEKKLQLIPKEGLDIIDSALQKTIDSNEELTRFEKLGLEAIILLINRPVIDITPYGLRSTTIPECWRILEAKPFWENKYGRRNAYASGKVKVPNNSDYLGSAVLIANNIVITNRHVVDQAEYIIGSYIKPSSNLTINFGSFFNHENEIIIPINECTFRSHDFDFACLEISKIDVRYGINPVIIENPSIELTKREAYIIGYPFSDRDEDVEILAEIFGFERGTKRLSPGKINGFGHGQIEHDCSTLQGSSGAGLFCLRSGHLLGLHFRGLRRRKNYAISMTQILDYFPTNIRTVVSIGNE